MFNMQIKSLAVILSLALSSLVTPASAAVTLNLIPSTTTVNAGNAFSVDVQIAGLESTEDLSAFDFNINFNASVLGFTSYTLGSQLGQLATFEATDSSSGNLGNGAINLSETSLLWDLSAQANVFTLATLYFVGNGVGNSALSFSNVTLGDAFGEPLVANLQTSAVTVTSVPEPETYAFLLSGFALVGLLRRRNNV
ncbi:cohesin domain-containing protein [Methylophilus aquaticus]|uniref:Cohesin domain-containing protein n=1 Tax=Methylophilus aquaticus TaxID=1971610 RepID=A0ABT9JVK6_9PROT|nr:cohesin domain-containing protein [Methylophilus aquaticus]MDP8568594.1 cohesin domain-containing protein [Methylophilus aquaticus]